MESRINKLVNITGNGPQRPSETTWSLPIMMLRKLEKRVFFSLSFLEINKKKKLCGAFKTDAAVPEKQFNIFFA